MSRLWFFLVRWICRIAVRAYYRSFRVTGRENVPAGGPVLVVVNHPNALLDAATVLLAFPRPVSFAAKSTLFRMPVLGFVLRRIGAVPVYRPKDAPGEGRKNLETFRSFVRHLEGGGAVAIFPEGMSHADPELKKIKSGPARIALQAEEAADFALGLKIVPVGLQYEPAQQFRGNVHVRIGRPFAVDDLRETPRREAIGAVQRRIAAALEPLILHLDRVDLSPLVERIATIYEEHDRSTSGRERPRPRSEVLRIAGACLNHYLVADPRAVDDVARRLARYDRLCRVAGVGPTALDAGARPVRTFLSTLALIAGLALGLPVWLSGLLTGYVPYRLTDRIARARSRRHGADLLPLSRILWGGLLFGASWAILGWLVHRWSRSVTVTLVFLAGVVGAGLFARVYAGWARRRFAALAPALFRARALRHVARARAELLSLVNTLAARYAEDAADPLIPPRELRLRHRIPWGGIGAVLLAVAGVWFAWGLGDVALDVTRAPASPWTDLPPAEAAETLRRDARSLTSVLETLERLEARMVVIEREFREGKRTYTDPEDDAEIRRALLTYLTARRALFRLVWFYREGGRPEYESRAFLLAYTAAVELVRRGMQFVEEFDDDAVARRKLNEGDAAWELPESTYERIRTNLASREVLDAMTEAAARFEELRAEGRFPADAPWSGFADRAAEGAEVVGALAERLWSYKWGHALERARRTVKGGSYAVSSLVSTWIGDARLRVRPEGRGLIRPAQLEAVREKLQPGDIIIERRNWYLSNAFLPGFWPHSAIWFGGADGLETLGIANHPDVAPVLARVRRPDDAGHERTILEAVSEGVVLTSLEHSVGEADAVCVLRPRGAREEIAAAVARAFRHYGKPYDFDFDFFSTDRLVCTELVYQAYEDLLDFDLVRIMGRDTLPAVEIVRKWAEERSGPAPELTLVAFLDADEAAGVAREGGARELIETLGRPGLVILQAPGGRPLVPWTLLGVLFAVLGLGLLLLRRRR